MRVLSVLHYTSFGGPHNRNLRLIPLLEQRGVETIVVMPDEPGDAPERFRRANLDLITMPLHRARETRDVRVHARFAAELGREVMALRRLIREQQIDVVLVNGLVNPHGALAGRLAGAAVVWQLVDTRVPRAARRVLMPLVTRTADIVMSTGLEVARQHGADHLGDRLVLFFPPVDTEEFAPDRGLRRRKAREALGVPDEALLVGMVGKLNPQKGHGAFVEAAGLVARHSDDVWFRILGAPSETHGAYMDALNQTIGASPLSDDGRLQIVNPNYRVAELLTALDVFVLPSVPRSEGIPTAMLEAMATGLPVVATDVGSVREAVSHGRTGIVVPPLQPDRLADAVSSLLQDAGTRASLGAEARLTALKSFSMSISADTHQEAFVRALQHRNARRRSSTPPSGPGPAA